MFWPVWCIRPAPKQPREQCHRPVEGSLQLQTQDPTVCSGSGRVNLGFILGFCFGPLDTEKPSCYFPLSEQARTIIQDNNKYWVNSKYGYCCFGPKTKTKRPPNPRR